MTFGQFYVSTIIQLRRLNTNGITAAEYVGTRPELVDIIYNTWNESEVAISTGDKSPIEIAAQRILQDDAQYNIPPIIDKDRLKVREKIGQTEIEGIEFWKNLLSNEK